MAPGPGARGEVQTYGHDRPRVRRGVHGRLPGPEDFAGDADAVLRRVDQDTSTSSTRACSRLVADTSTGSRDRPRPTGQLLRKVAVATLKRSCRSAHAATARCAVLGATTIWAWTSERADRRPSPRTGDRRPRRRRLAASRLAGEGIRSAGRRCRRVTSAATVRSALRGGVLRPRLVVVPAARSPVR